MINVVVIVIVIFVSLSVKFLEALLPFCDFLLDKCALFYGAFISIFLHIFSSAKKIVEKNKETRRRKEEAQERCRKEIHFKISLIEIINIEICGSGLRLTGSGS